MAPGLTVIVPAWNEEVRLAATVEEVVAAARRHLCAYEIIIVDDGSTDRHRGRCRIARGSSRTHQSRSPRDQSRRRGRVLHRPIPGTSPVPYARTRR